MKSLILALPLLGLACLPAAAERPASDDMGKLLAYTVNCTCVVGEKDWILDVYRQIFTQAYGEDYTRALQSPLQGALSDGWDRHMDMCERICDLPLTREAMADYLGLTLDRELQLALARADGGPVDASGVRAVLGPPPAGEPAVVYVSPEGGEAATVPATSGAAALAPIAPEVVPAAQVTEAEAIAVPDVEVVVPEPAGVVEEAVDDRPPDYFEAAGTGDNWSSALCRSSPSKPECRKAGGS